MEIKLLQKGGGEGCEGLSAAGEIHQGCTGSDSPFMNPSEEQNDKYLGSSEQNLTEVCDWLQSQWISLLEISVMLLLTTLSEPCIIQHSSCWLHRIME